MGARTTTALGGMLALTAGLLLGCGGSDSSSGTNPPGPSDAESLVGAALLPPDGLVSASGALGGEDLPPDGSASAVVADDDLPPAG